MPTPTPHANLPSLTAIAASNGALGVLALHALSLHDCIAALDARLAAVERDPLALRDRLASVERRLAAVEGCDSGPADLAAFVKEQAAMEAEVVDLRAKLAEANRAARTLREHLDAATGRAEKAEADLAAVAGSLGVESTRAAILRTIERVRSDIKRKDTEWSAMREERDRLKSDLAAIAAVAEPTSDETLLDAVTGAVASERRRRVQVDHIDGLRRIMGAMTDRQAARFAFGVYRQLDRSSADAMLKRADFVHVGKDGGFVAPAPAVDAGRLVEAYDRELTDAVARGDAPPMSESAMRRALATVGAGLTVAPVLTVERLAAAIEKCPFWIATGELRPDGTHESMHEDDAAEEILRHLGATIAPPAVPEAEPVAWGVGRRNGSLVDGHMSTQGPNLETCEGERVVPLYRSPPAVPREVVTVEEIVARTKDACWSGGLMLDIGLHLVLTKHVGKVIAAGGG